jgi:hypothetical protein
VCLLRWRFKVSLNRRKNGDSLSDSIQSGHAEIERRKAKDPEANTRDLRPVRSERPQGFRKELAAVLPVQIGGYRVDVIP